MASKKQEVALIVQSDDLPALELGHGWEKGLEQTSDCMAKSGDEVVQD
jgi:hypothetical protein